MSISRLIAFRYLRARREERFISATALFSLIGIALGVATLIVVLSVMRGVRDEITQNIIGLEGHVMVYSDSRGIAGFEDVADRLRKIEGVRSAVPLVEGQVMVSYNRQALGAVVKGVRPEDLAHKKLLIHSLTETALHAFQNNEGILIGQRMAERFGVEVGQSITLISPEGRATPAGTVPRVKAYPIVGIFKVGMFAYDNGMVLMPFAEAQRFFLLSEARMPPPVFEEVDIEKLAPNAGEVKGSGMATAIEVNGANPDTAPRLAKSITTKLGLGYRVYDWKLTNAQIFNAVMVQRNVMFLVLMLIVVVASFNIISSLIMLVREKRGDIAILRTIGASRGMVLRIFILCGMVVGAIGTLSGVALGLLIAYNTESIQTWLEMLSGQRLFVDELYFLSHLPAKVDGGEVLTVTGIALLLSFIASWIPARRAAKLNPVEILRYE